MNDDVIILGLYSPNSQMGGASFLKGRSGSDYNGRDTRIWVRMYIGIWRRSG